MDHGRPLDHKNPGEVVSLPTGERPSVVEVYSVSARQREQILSGLNLDLMWEYAAMVQYIQHASMLTGPEYVAIIQEELQHAQDEHEHAVILSDLIQYLGGIPTIEVAERLTSLDNEEMLRQDLQAEYNAIKRYLTRIQQLESAGLYDSAQKIRNIVVVEQNHAIELEKALGIRRATSPGPFGSNA
ncbi:MAG TPA: ferritin-like domain-containing protein [Firmicutes bacterium]|nr:ferritin-like domain-containing protein [Bacillota bacterium]